MSGLGLDPVQLFTARSGGCKVKHQYAVDNLLEAHLKLEHLSLHKNRHSDQFVWQLMNGREERVTVHLTTELIRSASVPGRSSVYGR